MTARNLRFALLLAAPLAAGTCTAAEVTTFDSCTDAAGRVLPADADYKQPMLVRTVEVNGQPEIRYNPGVLPRLTFAARLVLYAHECARQGMGTPLTVAQARRADCIGVNALLGADMLKRDDLPSLQAQLVFANSEWDLLPGPPRGFELTTCDQVQTGNLRMPSKALPSAQQTNWNNCARACGDRLWACQKRCSGAGCDGCLQTHAQCKSDCDGAAKPAD
ncbi:MAG TPA: hypothetical protein VMC81_10205 [Rhodocyclaceae bacterium]|nr:hypothetical protein [Rhodocyclaceae bacterium]